MEAVIFFITMRVTTVITASMGNTINQFLSASKPVRKYPMKDTHATVIA